MNKGCFSNVRKPEKIAKVIKLLWDSLLLFDSLYGPYSLASGFTLIFLNRLLLVKTAKKLLKNSAVPILFRSI
jgi:hypothetical protein